MKVGEYVRTEDGEIAKIINIYKTPIGDLVLTDIGHYWYKEREIIKSSPNIKKTLEVGDIITYEFPTGVGMIKYENVTILPELLEILQNGENNNEYKILSIVTKEQFESMQYNLESEVN